MNKPEEKTVTTAATRVVEVKRCDNDAVRLTANECYNIIFFPGISIKVLFIEIASRRFDVCMMLDLVGRHHRRCREEATSTRY